MKKFFLIVLTGILFTGTALSQDKGIFVKYKNNYWQMIKKNLQEYYAEEKKDNLNFQLDFSGYDLPESKEEFTYYWHNDPVQQGRTGTCWSFSTTSFFESEVYRIHNRKVKLSELYTVYWEYVEKARRFIRERGDSYFAEGSEADAVIRIWKQYGVVPYDDYTGLVRGIPHHDHSKMFKEMNDYLQSIKEMNAWNEEEALETIKSILNYYIGEPPTTVTIEGVEYTPQSYLNDYLKLELDDYVGIISLMEEPYYTKIVYPVPDNWWFSDDYHNVPLDEYMSILKNAVHDGYTVCIGGDVSEPGYNSEKEAAVVPDFDIPAEYINESSRQFRFTNGTTTDDHGIHIVGYKNDGGKDWYLVKDSGSGARNGDNPGYYFYHEDYVKLKIIDYLVHKDAVGDILEKFDK